MYKMVDKKNAEEVQVNWDKYAEQYDAITMSGSNPAYFALVKKVNEHFQQQKIKKNALIVDLGGGTGNFSIGALTEFWRENGVPSIAEMYPSAQFVIVDTSDKMLELAQEKVERKRLKNVDVIKSDVEDIEHIVSPYSRQIDHAFMIHCLYATRSKEDPEKPQRVLSNIYQGLKKGGSYMNSDINRQIKTGNWIPYCLWNMFKVSGFSAKKTLQFFNDNDQAKLANRHIDQKQSDGDYLICSLVDFIEKHRKVGFEIGKVIETSDKMYRRRDNLIRAYK